MIFDYSMAVEVRVEKISDLNGGDCMTRFFVSLEPRSIMSSWESSRPLATFWRTAGSSRKALSGPKIATSIVALFACIATTAHADESALTSGGSPVAKTSAAQIDPRLPPVLPGESIQTSSGRMRVWSTAGEVHGGAAGTELHPCRANSPHGRDCEPDFPSSVGVVIDSRRSVSGNMSSEASRDEPR